MSEGVSLRGSLAVFMLLGMVSIAGGRIIYVDDDRLADFNTIQAAIDDSNDGDTIIVADGIYKGEGNRDIDFSHGLPEGQTRAITVRSENGPGNCVIDCNGTLADKYRGFYFHSGEDYNSVVCGLTITNGYAERGGAIYCISSSPKLTNCIFRDCTAKYWSQSISLTLLEDTEAVVNDGNGVHIMIPPPQPQWRGDGGGINCCCSSNPLLTNCKFIGNWAYGKGGGMHNYRSSPTLINCAFTGNSARTGGGIDNWIYCRPTLANCTFTSNSSTNGNAVSCDSMSSSYPNVLEVINCILYDGGDEIWNNDNSTITVTYSDVKGGWPGTGNINADPCFVDPCNGDYHLKSKAGRWEPSSASWVLDDVTSRCIDAGNPGCPLGDEPNNVRINMGAYGGTDQASKSPANWRSIADITNDWVVNSNDLKVFVDYWLETGECIPSDLTRNQFVDFADFALFAEEFMTYSRLLSAYNPSPADGATDVSVDAKLFWEPGEGAVLHKVYFGTDPCALGLVAIIPAPFPLEFDPGDPNLIASTTYYWQIVEVDGPYTRAGPVWSFSTISGEAQPDYPANGASIPGSEYAGNIYTRLDYIAGPTTVKFTGYFHEDYDKVLTRHEDAKLGPPPYPQMPTRYYAGYIPVNPYAVSLERGKLYYWTVDGTDDKGNIFYGDIWEFGVQGYKAYAPSPADEATNVATEVFLSWYPGYCPPGSLFEHDVYIGTNFNDVNTAFFDYYDPPPELLDTVTEPNILVTGLEFNTKYYWRVDEVTMRLPPPIDGGSIYKGDIWCFTTVPSNVSETIVAGDTNGDCKVNWLDFRLMALHWLE